MQRPKRHLERLCALPRASLVYGVPVSMKTPPFFSVNRLGDSPSFFPLTLMSVKLSKNIVHGTLFVAVLTEKLVFCLIPGSQKDCDMVGLSSQKLYPFAVL